MEENIDVKKIFKRMKKIKYGFLINNKYHDPYKTNGNLYRTIPVQLIEKYNIGVCWDYVNFQQYLFNKSNIKCDAYLFIGNYEQYEIVTHAFTIITYNNTKYWFEACFKKFSGIHKVNSYEDVLKTLLDNYTNRIDRYTLSSYNTTGMDNNLTYDQFMNRACRNIVKRAKVM